MEMKKVNLSNVRAVGYDPENSVLHIDFGTTTYAYQNVPPEIYDGILAAGSPGKFFYAKIKGKFEFTKLEPKKEA